MGEWLTFDSGNLLNRMQGQAWVGKWAKVFGNPTRDEVGSIGFHNDSLQWDLSHSIVDLPGRRVSQDSSEAHRHVGEVVQKGLDDCVTANEAMPMDLVVRGHNFFQDVPQIFLSFSAVDQHGLV